jgi:ABC-type transport system involved in cytochrome c biogenesis permease subunit
MNPATLSPPIQPSGLDRDSLLDDQPAAGGWKTIQTILAPLASLKLTVVLLLLGIFIVFVGTLAQVEDDIWHVIQEYFRTTDGSFFVWIKPSLFFPPAFFPESAPKFSENVGFWFPKGWVIGLAMMLNLFAAHLIRFKIQAQGSRLWGGWLVTGLGAFVTALVILYGALDIGSQGYRSLWQGLALTLLCLSGVSTFAAVLAPAEQGLRRGLFGSLAVALGLTAIWSFQSEPFNPDAMRILYQLVLATGVSMVSLAGCLMLFKNRGGIVLIHAGIGLIMAHEVLVGVRHVESRMQIEENESVNFSSDIRSPELAIIDTSSPESDLVTVIPGSRLVVSRDAQGAPLPVEIKDSLLPFDVRVLDYFQNSMVRNRKSLTADDKAPENPANRGIGTDFSILPVQKVAGTDSGGQVDIPAAYVEFREPTGESLGIWLVTANYDEPQQVQYRGKTYDVILRFKRIYHDFSITLKDVQKNDYKGTNNPRDYSSYIRVEAPGGNFDQRIWMNNPMRYAGLTFYQSSYIPAGAIRRGSAEATVLQVVSNEGWMAPYVACMMVVVGMLAHFGLTLLRFLDRRQRAAFKPTQAAEYSWQLLNVVINPREGGWKGLAAGLLIFLGAWGYLYQQGRGPKLQPTELNVTGFGELPMWYKGRAMPIDTFARNALLQLSDRESYRPPSWAWVFELTGADAATLGEQRTALQELVSHLSLATRRTDLKFPEGWTVLPLAGEGTAANDEEDAEIDPDLVARVRIPSAAGDLQLQVRQEAFFVADYEGFTQGQIDAWRDLVGVPRISSYGWRAEMRRQQELVEQPLAEGSLKGQLITVAGTDSAVLGAIVTPTKELKKRTATDWLLTLMSDEDAARRLPVFRIENTDVISTLGLDPHRSGLTYSMAELEENFEALSTEAQAAAKVDPKSRNLRQKKVIELANRVILYRFLERTLGRPPQLPLSEQFGSQDPSLRRSLIDRFASVSRESIEEFMKNNRTGPKPLLVPVHVGLQSGGNLPQSLVKDWEVLATARIYSQFLTEQGSQAAPAITHFAAMLDAARDQDAEKFNRELQAYREVLSRHFDQLKADQQQARDDLPLAQVVAEAGFNRMEMFSNLAVFYVISLIVAFLGWMFAPVFNQRLSFALSVGLLCLYTYALCMRMYISGRPPVTNLYSSAIFIGWATVLGGLIMEGFTWRGFGNVVAAATGFAALRIADGLASDGDTIAVMEAVLDTQFWLATHVVCITLGYATTFLAGFLAILYLLRGMLTKVSQDDLQELSRLTYGTICFATFFSFFGTVLGGLWADDSWGRFWGWDPKENGALIIVLWNAVILHARWGGMIRARGIAILSILGNIVVSWSWFGVNELGVGLHSYGFTEGRLFWLGMFAASQLVLALLGLIPQSLWVSQWEHNKQPAQPAADA